MSSIDVHGLTMRFGDTWVLKDLALSVDEGSVTAILGSSGSGKSTLLRCIAGLLRPETGRITIGSTVVLDSGVWVPPERRGIGLVPQEGSLFPHLSVGANVSYGLRGRDHAARVRHLLDLVGHGEGFLLVVGHQDRGRPRGADRRENVLADIVAQAGVEG